MAVKEKKSSLRDIAKESGVSLKTVSRIVRGEVTSHKPSTCEKVLAVAERLKYRPNLAAGAVFGRQTRTVGMMIPFSDDGDHYSKLVKGAHDELIRNNYAPLLIFANEELGLMDQVNHLIDRRVDGILLRPMYESVDRDLLKGVTESSTPLVVVNRSAATSQNIDSVAPDYYGIGVLAAQSFIDAGHKEAAYLSIDYTGEIPGAQPNDQRWAGFSETLKKAGRSAILCSRQRKDLDIKAMAEELLNRPQPVTAIFVYTDRWCLEVYTIARKLGLSIPKDLSVIGCGNTGLCASMDPPLTSIDTRPYEMGVLSASRLLRMIEDKFSKSEAVYKKVENITLPPKLMVRGSNS